MHSDAIAFTPTRRWDEPSHLQECDLLETPTTLGRQKQSSFSLAVADIIPLSSIPSGSPGTEENMQSLRTKAEFQNIKILDGRS